MFIFRDQGAQAGDFILGQCLHFGVGQHRLSLGQIIQRAAIGGDLVGHGAQVAVFARDFGNL